MWLYGKQFIIHKWISKYHIVSHRKYRRKIIYCDLREDIQRMIKDLCKWKGVESFRRAYDARSCPFASIDTTQNEYILVYGIFEGQKH